MAKLQRKKTEKVDNVEINLNTGDVTPVVVNKPEAWPIHKKQEFEKCKSLVGQITNNATNIVDEKNINEIAHALATFHEAGRELFNQVCLYQQAFDSNELKDIFDKAIRTARYKRAFKFINICAQFGISVLIGDDNYNYFLMEGNRPVDFTDQLDNDHLVSIQEYKFAEIRNQYYFANFDSENKRITLEPRSNFVMKVLYHINRGKGNKRVISLVNNRNEKTILEVETKQLSSLQSFKTICEEAGYYVIQSSFKDDHLQRVKMKMFKEEKTSQQLEVLGWDVANKFFAFCNGVYVVGERKFFEVDEYGIVPVNKKHFHIPYHPGTDPHTSLNEKLIFYRPTGPKFEDWSKLFLQTFEMMGATVMMFTIATIFSDHIFLCRSARNFPMLFLYGEGGSGKGTVCDYAQTLFGQPQPPLKIAEKANTDKARIRKFAAFCNMPVRLEEFTNSIDHNGILTLQNLYDRFGYERSSAESRYGTETVPVRSSVIILGNEYPSHDPLMQRLILLDHDKNKHSEEQVSAIRELKKLNAQGLTSVLIELLNYRDVVEKDWINFYEGTFDDLRERFKDSDIPSRMIENYAVLLATYQCLSSAGLKWPFTYDALKEYFIKSLINQTEKRNTGAVVQRFWDIVLSLASNNLIHEEKHYLLDGNSLYIRWKELHIMYMMEHQKVYRQSGLQSTTLLQKLKISPAFVRFHESKRFSAYINTSAFEFEYSKLNIDLNFVKDKKQEYIKKRDEAWNSKLKEADSPPPPDDSTDPDFIKNTYGFENP